MEKHLGIDFGSILVSFWSQVGSMLVPRTDSKRDQFCDYLIEAPLGGVPPPKVFGQGGLR